MMSNVLILNGNPKPTSFCGHLSDAYELEARKNSIVHRFDISEMNFNPSLDCGYEGSQTLEKCLSEFQKSLLWADHIVIVSPIWWGGLPAKLKGLIERVFLPGKTFQYESGSPEPVPLLTGKTSRLIFTMDAPEEFSGQQAQPVIEQLDRFTLQFCGVESAEPILFSSVSFADKQQVSDWLETIKALGAARI